LPPEKKILTTKDTKITKKKYRTRKKKRINHKGHEEHEEEIYRTRKKTKKRRILQEPIVSKYSDTMLLKSCRQFFGGHAHARSG
jgi:hypothetical protein